MKLFVGLLLLLQCYRFINSETASFFGASFISVPLQEAKSTTQVNFKFLSKRPDALLFLAAGKTDYCLIKLEAGRLKVHINLGAGESAIASPRGLRLDDLVWHQVSIMRKDADITLTIDSIHITREKLPGRFFELNIHYGLFVGGQGEFFELFLGHGEWLRGCISDLNYNGVSPLMRARQRTGHAQAHAISWTCAAEFHAAAKTEISFVDEGAFMSLPNSIPRTGARWQFEVKTTALDGILLYSSGGGENSDFVGVELVNGLVRVILDKGGGATVVVSDKLIADGMWHNITVNFNPSLTQVIVDEKETTVKLIQTATRHFDLGDIIYMGGIELNKRARALGQGLKNADTSLKGCMRSLHISSKPVGFPHAKVTQGLLANCVWSYPCTNDPCTTNATCVPRGVDSFMCMCEKEHCIREDFPESYTVYSKISQLQLVELNPLSVFEGQNILISPSHISVVLDYAKYGIRDSGVIFSMVSSTMPKHGRLAIEVWEKSDSQLTFTLLDLAKDKVRYVHDGSESSEDNIVLDLEFSPGSGFILPSYLQGQHRFILHVNITPVNDAPSLIIPVSKVLRLAQGTRKVITTSLLNATDPDSPRDKLVYAVVGDGNGRIEKINQPGVSLNTFTQIEIDQGSIVYFHNSSITGNTKLIFQVSDGIVTSQSAYLRVNVTPLVLRLLNNTGALLTLHSYILITPANLTFTTNSDDPSLQIVYKIVGSCEFGVVERGTDLGGNVTWQIVKEFTSTHLSQELVRYRHTNGKPVQDMFKFKVSVQDIESSLVYDFRLTFAELKLESIHMTHLRLNGIVQIFISADNLMYATTPISVNPVKITYTLIKLPLFGNLFKNFDETRILYGYNFTQGDINMGKIKYKMLRTTYVPVEDEISFQVSTDHCDFESVVTLKFFYTPPKNLPHRLKTTLKSVKVKEGGTVPILITELNVQVVSVKSIDYQIVSGPNHGMLTLLDPIQNSTESNITNFTPSQIAAGRLIYTHDGTETTSDFIQFLALSSVEDDFMTVGILNMSVTLVNDNVPVRTVAKVFRIVSGGQRLLTTRHIKFKDDDMDFRANDLIYTVKNGSGIFSSGTKIPLKQFTQGDLEAGKVLVIENGQGGTQILLSVSDGIHTTECILDIRPSPPYIEITNNSHLVVSQGGQATITNANLFSDTNVNIKPQDIRYDILSGPNQGEILMSSQPGLTTFTQGDVESGLVIYKHLSTGLAQDRIQLKVTVENIFAEGWLAVRVFPAAYWEPLVVITNQTLYVEESTSVSLTGQFLQVKQAGVPPSDITFLVLTGPEGGYLEVEGSEEERAGEDDDKGGIRAFDQATVDAGKLYYVQVSANQTHDRIIVDVTNGISWLRSLIIKLIVVPSKIYLAGQELKVDEGGFVIFPHNAFASISPFYINKITDYFILENPVYGSVVIGPNNKSVSKWTAHQLKSSLIKYVHDGSETLNDTFTIIGRAGDKESVPVAVKVQILPVNDMIPKVVNRTEVSIWRGGSHLITSEHLAAVDRDTPPENLTFAIVSAVGGYVALITNKSASIDRFTQEQINNEDVLLVHNGGKERAEFEAVVVDGVNKFGPITLSSRIIELSLNLSSNVGLHIFPLLRKPIGKQLLYGYCSDPSREVYYKITSQPMKGKLFVNSFSTIHNNEQPVFNFTQSDINDLRVWYQHTMPFSEAAANDSFMFDLMADYVQPLRDNVFHIDISVLSGGLDQLLDVSSFSIHVEEGGVGIVHLNTSGILEFLSINVGIEKPIIHGSITLLPQHGNVCFIEDCNTTIFTIVQLQSGNIVYQHDHSDTLEDLMQISLYLDPGDVLLCNITFLIKINPVNDQEFKLITESPHITVVQGQEVVITDQDLYTEDLDSAASDIIYDIIDGPNLGNIMIGNETIQKFTQSDINNRKVRYKHKGLLQPTSFYFRVSDGKFNPAYTVFNIAVIQIILNVSVVLPVSLQQGSNVVHISDKILHLITNANEETILYNVSTLPRHGIVYVYDVPTLQFTHKQLMNKKVMYMQTDMTTPSDTFELVAHTGLEDGPIVSGLWVNVSVEPLIIYGEFSPLSGTKTRLDTSAIDATPLAKLTNSNPVYKILKRPKYGRLRKIIHSSGERKFTREKDVSKFSHEELQNGVIYYVSRRTLETVEDRFPFLLSASIFQPAIGEIRFEVIGESPSTTFRPPKPRIPDPQSPVGRNGVEMASPNMSDDYLLGVTMVTGVIALALLIVGFVRCGTKHTEEENSLKPDLPDPLPQPPDDLLPSSPRLAKRNTPVLTPVALPQCKIPGDSITSSEPDLNLRYPYGDEDWSSYDTTDIAFQSKNSNNPMLRKNQYWV